MAENLGWYRTLEIMRACFPRRDLNLNWLLILETKVLLLKHVYKIPRREVTRYWDAF